MIAIIESALEHFPDAVARGKFYADMIVAFEHEDCDTLSECPGIDIAYDELRTDEE